ncbi:family 43 glycosylhydrolase [Microbacterium sp. SSM24]|uniref:family 43 glycosylhydrolase n=1 Tax=Microbacterium sp. SSM24 TaxID=2991714 RepID=UPI00222724BC|nr:family 43 glycosylhydrolase [Microbacterium sp. SSM24]MCW3491875.1 family 43 glycosylhydrolase [Microbacterium sp. SSM24]
MVWTTKRAGAALAAGAVVALVAALIPATAGMAATENPIIGDGSVYSADPSLLADGDTLYIHAGRDEAGTTTNDFIMNEWQAFSTTDVDGGAWQHHPSLMRPETVFDWATPGRAYAGQVVKGVDGRFYWYVPVHEAASTAADKFGIGVAVSSSPLGPWTDHAGGPIVSQAILGNDAHNIDPTVLVDGGRVWMYWGSFSRLMAIELQSDMKTRIGTPTTITSGVTGFFEAAWLFKRDATYYLAYAANNAGPTSTCTPANYHACIAYSTASSPLGPWTFRGRILAPVSSTTSHPAIAEFQGEWYMAYHTADAVGGNHFRRSVAIDHLEWDDTQTPARIVPVTTTPVKGANLTPRSNVAPWATASASNEPIPTQYWIKALNDEIIRPNPLPPDMWGSWTANRPAQQWIQYDWDAPVRLDRARIKFWRDIAPGTGNGVSDPASWVLQYWDAGAWKDVPNPSGYPTSTTAVHQVTFGAVTTSRLRAVLGASPNAANPPSYSAVAVEEWEVHAAQPDTVAPVEVQTVVGTAPELPETVDLAFGDDTLAASVRWDAVDPADVAAAGQFTVQGFVEGYAAGLVTATVTVLGEDPWRANLALTGTPSAGSTAAGSAVAALNDEAVAYTGVADPVWTADATTWAGYTWDAPVRVDGATAHFWTGGGVAVPQSWAVEALVDGEWRAVTGAGQPSTVAGEPNTATFDAVTTTAVRVALTAQTGSGVGLSELEIHGETIDADAPEVALAATGVDGANGWFLSPVTVRATATDDRDVRTRIALSVDGGAWQETDNVRFAEATVSGDGTHTVRARATDAAGNTSAEASVQVRIDATRPTVTGTLDIVARTVSATAADAGSGIAVIEYALDAPTGWQAYGAPVPVDAQRHVVYLRSKDAAGNVSALGTVTVPLSPDAPLEGNIAPIATPTASYTSSWNSVTAVNDGALTGASWGTWPNVGEQWVQLEWDRVVTVDRAGVLFFRDSADAAGVGMIPPREWKLQYVDLATGAWKDVEAAGAYGRSSTAMNEVSFAPVTTTKLRALMQAWGSASAGGSSGILEFEAWAAEQAEPEVDVEITVTTRCVASKVALVVTAGNGDEVPATVAVTTPYGTKTWAGIAPGAQSTAVFSTRLPAMPAGAVDAEITAVVGGETVAAERSVDYVAASCGAR